MFDPAVTASAVPFFMAATGAAGLLSGLLAEWLIRRLLPRLAVAPSRLTRITTPAATFVLSAMLAWRFGASPELGAFLVLGVTGIQLARIDVAHHILPNRLVLSLLAAGMVLLTAAASLEGALENLLRAGAGAVTMFVLYLVLALTSRNGLGLGDVKLAAPLGLYLGYLGWSQLFYGAFLGFVAGGLSTLVLVLKNRENKPKEVAHGPSMLAAVFAVILLVS